MIVTKIVSFPADAKRKFMKLDDIHYYSLAPSPVRVRFYRGMLSYEWELNFRLWNRTLRSLLLPPTLSVRWI